MLEQEGKANQDGQGHRQHNLGRAPRIIGDEHPVDDHEREHRQHAVFHLQDHARHVALAEELRVHHVLGEYQDEREAPKQHVLDGPHLPRRQADAAQHQAGAGGRDQEPEDDHQDDEPVVGSMTHEAPQEEHREDDGQEERGRTQPLAAQGVDLARQAGEAPLHQPNARAAGRARVRSLEVHRRLELDQIVIEQAAGRW